LLQVRALPPERDKRLVRRVRRCRRLDGAYINGETILVDGGRIFT
jgi:hypothetical protein